MDDDSLDILFKAYEELKKQKTVKAYIDPDYPDIKFDVKFTPKERTHEYSVFMVVNHKPKENKIDVNEIMYLWCGGYYKRVNKDPILTQIDRDELLRTHRVAKR